MTTAELDDRADEHVDDEIAACLDVDAPKSFFLFAGAGSGKTRSLVKALEHLRSQCASSLRLHGRRVAVITYTNAACDEIIRRTEFDPIFSVSTIHSFAWSIIQGFTHDIREWLRQNLKEEIAQLQLDEAKGRPGTKASVERRVSIASKSARLAILDEVKVFSYDPNGDNVERNSLSHSEVLKLASHFIRTKRAMQRILLDGFPFILIDESQDTNKALVEALFAFQAANSNVVGLGMFGDMMQRIYADGKDGLDRDLPGSWATPTKRINWRCPRRVVTLINKVRSAVDGQVQQPRSKAAEGQVRFFILRASEPDKPAAERRVAAEMARITGDEGWTRQEGYKALILEHHMAASRMHFDRMFAALYPITRFRTGLLDGTLAALTLFSQRVLPIIDAYGDKFAIARIVRASSPLLSADALRNSSDQLAALANAQNAVDALLTLFQSAASPTFGDVLRNLAATGLFEIPNALRHAAFGDEATNKSDAPSDQPSERAQAIDAFLATPFEQIRQYSKYVSGAAGFVTHQGVKGLEFPRVMVIIDDTEARGFAFKYEKLFAGDGGVGAVVAGTRRLLYVTCSRAQESLAIVAYAQDPKRVRRYLLENGWFEEREIVGAE
jgi:DNA helicase-2/ATP-dependent DNA helicase PcrA